jgi:hypothetical protein
MKKITLKDIKDAEQSISQIVSAKVDFKLAYRINKIMSKLIVQMEEIEKMRIEIIEKYAAPEKDKDGNLTGRKQVPPEKHQAFNKEFIDYLQQPSDIEIEQIPYEMLETSGIKVSSTDILALEKFIAEPKNAV